MKRLGLARNRSHCTGRKITGRLLLAYLMIVLLPGCGGESRQPLLGDVTLDGKPLAAGYICFRPEAGTSSPTSGAAITAGHFSIDRKGGPMAGRFRVEITAVRPGGKGGFDVETGENSDILVQYLPPRYNTQSELAVEVTADGPNKFPFDLTSKPDSPSSR